MSTVILHYILNIETVSNISSIVVNQKPKLYMVRKQIREASRIVCAALNPPL
jgi:hypothetical protein